MTELDTDIRTEPRWLYLQCWTPTGTITIPVHTFHSTQFVKWSLVRRLDLSSTTDTLFDWALEYANGDVFCVDHDTLVGDTEIVDGRGVRLIHVDERSSP